MRRPLALTALITVGLVGCSTPRPPTLDYLPPSGPPASARSAMVRQPPWLVWGNVLDRLQQQGFEVSEVDEAAGELIVHYRGDPQPYVDCGWIVAYQEAELARTPAAAGASIFQRLWQGKVATIERGLELDARMTVRVEPEGESAVVSTDSLYGLTKTVAPQAAGDVLHRETIDFRSGESGSFSAGTVCQPNGALERVVLDALPSVSFAEADAAFGTRWPARR
jgi:hypothetical protein